MWIYYRLPIAFQLIQQIQIRDRLEWIREQLQQIRDRELPEHISSLEVFDELSEMCNELSDFAELDGIRAFLDLAWYIINHSEDLGIVFVHYILIHIIAGELLNHLDIQNLN